MHHVTPKITILLLTLFLFGCSKRPDKFRWDIVGQQGMVRFIYIDPAALEDAQFLTELVSHLSSANKAVQLMFFDDRAATPSVLPMSDEEMLHYRAIYNYNPYNGLETFAFIEITRTSPPEFREIPAATVRRSPP